MAKKDSQEKVVVPVQEAASSQEKERDKKQILLRVAPSLWKELASWAEEDFRSINGQIEYLLSEAVKKRKRGAE